MLLSEEAKQLDKELDEMIEINEKKILAALKKRAKREVAGIKNLATMPKNYVKGVKKGIEKIDDEYGNPAAELGVKNVLKMAHGHGKAYSKRKALEKYFDDLK